MSSIADALRQMRLPPGFNQDLLVAAADALDRFELKQATDHRSTMHMIQSLRDVFQEEKAQWQTDRERHDKDMEEVMHAIADYLLVPIGEHTSSNCPWMRALEEIENAPAPFDTTGTASQLRLAARQQQEGGSDAQ